MEQLNFLQHYWWFIISFLGSFLVVMMFVQGGQTLLPQLAKTDIEKRMILLSMGRKWEITFTTLVTFGGAFFASFPLFYSTSFGGAYWLWMVILFSFIVQAVAYENMNKPGNLLGKKGYRIFLYINGTVGVVGLGVAVAMLFTGSPFSVGKDNITNIINPTISRWQNPWHGLEAFLNWRNLLLGASLFFLARVSGALYIIFNVNKESIRQRAFHAVIKNELLFLPLFIAFLVAIFLSKGFAVDPSNQEVFMQPYKYFLNFIQMPLLLGLLLVGVVMVLLAFVVTIKKKGYRYAFWIHASGVFLTVLALLMSVGYNNTAYYPSTYDIQDSLTIYNSSSSYMTLKVMSYATILIPIVSTYGFWCWRSLDRGMIQESDFSGSDTDH